MRAFSDRCGFIFDEILISLQFMNCIPVQKI
jgi:hypothetical protein